MKFVGFVAAVAVLTVLRADEAKAVKPGLTEQTITALEYFPRWESQVDADAHEAMVKIIHQCPDFASFQKAAPAGSKERALVLRFFDSFEDAGNLIRSGRMNEGLFFDSWYAMPRTWDKTRIFVLGLRQEQNNPRLYEAYEWLGNRSVAFLAEREAHPPQWHPISYPEPTAEDRKIFATFDRVSPRWPDSWRILEGLKAKWPTYDAFRQHMTENPHDYVLFDEVLCYYDRAGLLVQYGILHPRLLFTNWRSSSEVWDMVKYIIPEYRKDHAGAYGDIDWLVEFEREWRARPENAGAPIGKS